VETGGNRVQAIAVLIIIGGNQMKPGEIRLLGSAMHLQFIKQYTFTRMPFSTGSTMGGKTLRATTYPIVYTYISIYLYLLLKDGVLHGLDHGW
jgi:hypothetical protein